MHFDPTKLPPRGEDGYTDHPDMWDPRWWDGDPADEAPLNLDAFHAAGLECGFVSREAQQEDFDWEEDGCASWSPSPPSGDGWRLVSIHDTEDDGASAFYVRDLARSP